jgi:hypothetical protein
MVRRIRLRYHWLSNHHIPTEEVIKRRVRESVAAGMRDTLLEGKFFKGVAKGTSAQSVQCLLCGEHRLIMVCIEIPSNNEPIYRRDFRSNEVADMRHQLIYGVFPRFRIFFAVSATGSPCVTRLLFK